MSAEEPPPLSDWRQGDIALLDCELPILSLDNGEPAVIFTEGSPVVVISQSCDIIRSPLERPYLQIAVLMPANADEMAAVKAGARPRYGYVAAAEPHGLVADFDVTATVDKDVVAGWARTPGCTDDGERRDFAAALARHRQRFAFPDAFNSVVKPLRKFVEGKRSKSGSAGDLVRALREIRASCANWDKPEAVTITFILDEWVEAMREEWGAFCSAIAGKMSAIGFAPVTYALVTYDDISAREYVNSEKLDLDGLSDS